MERPSRMRLALYFTKYVQAYKAAGINIGMVMPQNEPTVSSNYTSCQWSGEQLAKFVGYQLGPRFKQDHVGSQIYLGALMLSMYQHPDKEIL